jgi:CubicO group peptidase (beta-lactamase class C family)
MTAASVATARDGEIVAEIGGDVIVPWWSVGKTVLAAVALTLVRDGAFGLDDRVNGERYTLRQLLQHRSGLGDYGDLADYHAAVGRGDAAWPADEMLRRAEAGRLRYPPGEGWRYSNIGYLVVRRMIERACALSLEAALKARVLDPLGITEARLAVGCEDLVGVAMGAAASYDPGWVYHGLLVGPLREAALLLDRLLGGALLPPHLLSEMLRAHRLGSPLPDRPWRAPAYGLGLMIDATGPGGPAGHTGGGPGSVIAVYRTGEAADARTNAAFALGGTDGEVEHAAFSPSER